MCPESTHLEPSPSQVLSGTLSLFGRKTQAFGIIIGIISLFEIGLFISIGVSALYFSDLFLVPILRAFYTFWLLGLIAISYMLTSVSVYLYRYARYDMSLQPRINEELRLQVMDQNFNELYGVYISVARSVLIFATGFIFTSFWSPLLDYILQNLPRADSIDIFNLSVGQASSTFLTIADIITTADLNQAIDLIQSPEFTFILRFVPIFAIGYISYRHLMYIYERTLVSGQEHIKLRTEIEGLLIYSWKSVSEVRRNTDSKLRMLALWSAVCLLSIFWNTYLILLLA